MPHRLRMSLALCALSALASAPAGALASPPAAAAQAPRFARPDDAPRGHDAIEAVRREARSKAAARKFAEAIAAYERLLALAPGDADAQAHLAQLQAWTGNYD